MTLYKWISNICKYNVYTDNTIKSEGKWKHIRVIGPYFIIIKLVLI